MENKFFWHTLTVQETAKTLSTDLKSGLSQKEVQLKKLKFGDNSIYEKASNSPFKIFLNQFSDFMIILLFGSALVAFFLGESTDAIVILVILFANAAIGFTQEYQAEKAINSLKKLAQSKSHVLRDQQWQTIDSSELVPGDITYLEAGDIISADLRVISENLVYADESALTGESIPTLKNKKTIESENIILNDQMNILHKGTVITQGSAQGIVIRIGMQTEIGKIAHLINTSNNTKTPLQIRLTKMGKYLAIISISLSILVFILGLSRGEKPLLMLMTAISLAVAAIPESLPAVITVLLALGSKRLVKHKALIRHLPSVETLGSVSYICSDKTGTITENKMHVHNFHINDKFYPLETNHLSPPLSSRLLFTAMALNNDIKNHSANSGSVNFQNLSPNNKNSIHPAGEPTELALFQFAEQQGYNKFDLEKKISLVHEIPFSSERAMMSIIIKTDEERIYLLSKGSPEKIIKLSHSRITNDAIAEIEKNTETQISFNMASNGLRVLAFAYKELNHIPSDAELKSIENDLCFIGLVGLIDPPRPHVKQAITDCLSSSINVIMITGDHPATAFAIGKMVGLISPETIEMNSDLIVTGNELASISNIDLKNRLSKIKIFARVSPEQKIKIVKTLQDMNEIVAMTGDGINDAPALKQADIGIAMGKNGTDVARNASSLILLDNDFSTIVNSVKEGRRIYDNVKKFIKYSLTTNFSELFTIVLTPLLGFPNAFLPIQILWINLITDGLPGLALAMEPSEKDIMQRPPEKNKNLFSNGLWQHILILGCLMTALNIASIYVSFHYQLNNWRTILFTTMTFSQMVHILAIRSGSSSIFNLSFFTNNPYLISAVSLTILMQLGIIYSPYLNKIFHTQPLTGYELLFCVLLSSSVFIAIFIEKFILKKKFKNIFL